MRYFLHSAVCNLVTLVKATSSSQQGDVFEAQGHWYELCPLSKNNSPGARAGCLPGPLWSPIATDRRHLKFEFCPETSGGSPSQEKRLVGYKDICPKGNHVFFLQGALVNREEGTPDKDNTGSLVAFGS